MGTPGKLRWFIDHASWDLLKEIASWLFAAGTGGVLVSSIFHLVPTYSGLIAVAMCLVGFVWAVKSRTTGNTQVPAPLPDDTPKPQAGDITIHSATWGPTEAESIDVAAIVRQRAHRNFVNIPIENAVFGDPTPGRGKSFTVLYSITKRKTILERPVSVDRLVLPEPEVGAGGGPSGPTGPR